MKCSHRKEGENPAKGCVDCEAKADRRRYFQDRTAKQRMAKTAMEERGLQGRDAYEVIYRHLWGERGL